MTKSVIKSDVKLPNVHVYESDEYYYVAIYANERTVETLYDYNEKPYRCLEYDANDFKELKSNINIDDVKSNPMKYFDYEPLSGKTLEQQVNDLRGENQMLTDCILELSTFIYQ